MSDQDFEDLARAAASGMSRRRMIRLMIGGAAAGALAKGGNEVAAPTSAEAATNGQLAAARQLPPAGGGAVCAVLLSLAASFRSIPFIGSFLNSLVNAFGCPISGGGGGDICLPVGSSCSTFSSQQCCGTCFAGVCTAQAQSVCCQCTDSDGVKFACVNTDSTTVCGAFCLRRNRDSSAALMNAATCVGTTCT
jgi:hypothetical protein